MNKLIMVLLLLSLAIPLKARLSESTTECENRYGKPLYSFTDTGSFLHNYYLKGEFFVQITFKDSKAVGICYSKPDVRSRFYQQLVKSGEWKDIDAYLRFINLRMFAYEMEMLRKYNAEGCSWDEALPGSIWHRSDGTEALYDTTNNTFSINRPEYTAYLSSKAEKGLIGF